MSAVIESSDSSEARTLKSLTGLEVLKVLRFHSLPEKVLSVFALEEIDGNRIEYASELEDFMEIGIDKPKSKFLVSLVEEMRGSGVPAEWLLNKWTSAYDHFNKARCLKNAAAVTWLERHAANGNVAAKAYPFEHSIECAKVKPKEPILLRNDYSRLLQSTDVTEQMHAEYFMGICYDFGLGGDVDRAQAVTWWRKSADRGHAEAQYWLGISFFCGRGVPEDRTQAESWYHKAAEQDHAKAQYELAYFYQKGHVVTKDLDQAIALYRRSAAQGYSDAIAELERLNVSLV